MLHSTMQTYIDSVFEFMQTSREPEEIVKVRADLEEVGVPFREPELAPPQEDLSF